MAGNFPLVVNLMVIDADATVLEFFKNYCSYNVTTFLTSGEALKHVVEGNTAIDIIVMENHMLGLNGIEFIKSLNKKNINIPVILMSYDYSYSPQFEAYKLGACDYWCKPVELHHLKDMEGKKIMKLAELSRKEEDSRKKWRRMTWTKDMHYQFELAILSIGLENAKPKKIHELMSIPGLEVKHISNHLKTYRKKLKAEQQEQEQQEKEQQEQEQQEQEQQQQHLQHILELLFSVLLF